MKELATRSESCILRCAERAVQQVGFKPAGGIRSCKDALAWLSLMLEELGSVCLARFARSDLSRVQGRMDTSKPLPHRSVEPVAGLRATAGARTVGSLRSQILHANGVVQLSRQPGTAAYVFRTVRLLPCSWFRDSAPPRVSHVHPRSGRRTFLTPSWSAALASCGTVRDR